jgi:hypothetical protein
MSSAHWEMLAVYGELLGKNCWKHVACIITHVDYNADDELTLEEYKNELNDKET